MPVTATHWIRKMRGGSQAHMIVADDGHHYVVKVKQNAQHRRILVNEWLAGHLLDYLKVPSARMEMVKLTPEFLSAHPDIAVTVGSRIAQVEPGWHFGSQVPVDPNRFAIYDYLPDALLREIANLRDFLAVLVFDKWASNADSRQCVFFRAKVKEYLSGEYSSKKVAFVALMMDHGYVFGGPHWLLEDGPLTGLYSRPLVYERVTGLDSFRPWLDMAVNAPDSLLDEIYRKVPEWWLNGDREELERLLERLWRRRPRIPYLIEDSRHGRVNLFPNWVS
ncbi:MAG: hypothetical protein HY820_02665 [Acidobacteria bacterium]|nr:hypothetical protein [Acidobacteriota bacterium]